MAMPMSNDRWPALPYAAWQDTYATLHMWIQVIGKVALAKSPPLNHSWAIALQITSTGLSTRLLTHGPRTFTIEFNFMTHELWIRTSDGDARMLPLAPRPVADFYREVMATLSGMQLPVKIYDIRARRGARRVGPCGARARAAPSVARAVVDAPALADRSNRRTTHDV